MKVTVDMGQCQANGACVIAAPEVFDLDDEDVLHWVEDPGQERRAEVEEAVRACPVQAITLEA
jgi:ferredoxin